MEERYLIYRNELTRMYYVYDNIEADSDFLNYIKTSLLSRCNSRLKTLYSKPSLELEIKDMESVLMLYNLANFMNLYVEEIK